jgi:uncharacterized repeat protein (TIGR03803 family)
MKLSQLIVCYALCSLAVCSSAETFTTIKTFGILTNITGSEPNSLVQGPDGLLYGTANSGEGNVLGTIYKVQPDGTGFTVLKWFTNPLEGANPSSVIIEGNTIYGTTSKGGADDVGTVFKMNTDGTGFAILKEFMYKDNDVVTPRQLIISGNTLYGAASFINRGGSIFKLATDGSGYATLKTWTDVEGEFTSAICLADGVLYGSTYPSTQAGTFFRMNVDGTSFSVLKQTPAFAMTLSQGVLYGVNSTSVFKMNIDGSDFSTLQPFDGNVQTTDLKLANGVLYVSTMNGGNEGVGSVFRLGVDGSDFRVLKHFSESEGFWPVRLLISDSVILGLTLLTGPPPAFSDGTLFRLSTDGTGYTTSRLFGPDPDGAAPSSLALSGGQLYGTTRGGGISRRGTVYKVNPDGSGYTILQQFDELGVGILTNINGVAPGKLLVDGSSLFGINEYGGIEGSGTVYRMNADGTGIRVLKTFNAVEAFGSRTNIGGAVPSNLILADDFLIGATALGGSNGFGTVFRLNKDGSGFRVLKEFGAGSLTLSGTTLYGTGDALFSMNIQSLKSVTLREFSPTTYDPVSGWFTNSEGSGIIGEFTVAGDSIYGTATGGGHSGLGTVFRMKTDGTGFVTLKHFEGSDGARPTQGVKLSGGVLYGVTALGGTFQQGTVFRLSTNGSAFSVIKHLTQEEGWAPGTFLHYNHALYGALAEGGMMNRGVLFKIDLLDAITIRRQSDSVVLSWPDPSISLQASRTAEGGYLNIPGSASPYTNRISSQQEFFRLRRN